LEGQIGEGGRGIQPWNLFARRRDAEKIRFQAKTQRREEIEQPDGLLDKHSTFHVKCKTLKQGAALCASASLREFKILLRALRVFA
jgi:hypothetical protein